MNALGGHSRPKGSAQPLLASKQGRREGERAEEEAMEGESSDYKKDETSGQVFSGSLELQDLMH